jgi:hypothetical protein
MTAAEYKNFQAKQEAAQLREVEAIAREEARQSALQKLAAIGLTEAEIKALGGI